jgi:hypothetical protein
MDLARWVQAGWSLWVVPGSLHNFPQKTLHRRGTEQQQAAKPNFLEIDYTDESHIGPWTMVPNRGEGLLMMP